MPKLYIANTLKQQQIIFYRMDFDADGGGLRRRHHLPPRPESR